MARVLLLLPKTTYRSGVFMQAASALDLDLVVGSNHKATLSALAPGKTLALNFEKPDGCVETIRRFAGGAPFDAVLGFDDETVIPAAYASRALGLHHNPVEALEATRNKYLMRQKFSTSDALNIPWFEIFSTHDEPESIAQKISYPCVLKPTFLSASQGVIRANNPEELTSAFGTIREILSQREIRRKGGPRAAEVLIESYLPGREFALEGLMIEGGLRSLSIFDKPDPLEGPWFIETIYTVPTRLDKDQQHAIEDTVERAVGALGLISGPIHAEVRLDGNRVYLLEIAARPIGGLCSRVLRFDNGISLETLLLKHALGDSVSGIEREKKAAAVMMMPVPSGGRFRSVKNLGEARRIAGIEEIVVSIPPGQILEPLPRGARYFGFIFARADSASVAEEAIRTAYRTLEPIIDDV